MTPPIRRIAALAACAAVVVVAACGGKESTTDTQSRPIDLAPANPNPPALSDAPVVPPAAPQSKAPVTRASEPRVVPRETKAPEKRPDPIPTVVTPPVTTNTTTTSTVPVTVAPSPTTGVIETGTSFTLRPATKICSNTHKVGDQFTATLASPMHGSNGVEVPEGAVAILRIVQSSRETKTDSAHLSYDIVSLRSGENTYEVVAHVTQSAPLERVNTQSRTDAAKKVGAGAVIGAIAGRVLGGNTKGAVIGGAVGAAAGAAVAVSDNKVEGCLKTDGTITLALDRPLVIKLPAAP